MSEERVMGGGAVKVVLVAALLLAPIVSLYRLAGTLSAPVPGVDFLVYRARYNATDGTVTAWIDHSGTRAAYGVQVSVGRGLEWAVDQVGPDEFIRISYERPLSAQDFPYWEEVLVEWEYLEGDRLVDGCATLYIILTRSGVIS
jgi:hypothetical protein